MALGLQLIDELEEHSGGGGAGCRAGAPGRISWRHQDHRPRRVTREREDHVPHVDVVALELPGEGLLGYLTALHLPEPLLEEGGDVRLALDAGSGIGPRVDDPVREPGRPDLVEL